MACGHCLVQKILLRLVVVDDCCKGGVVTSPSLSLQICSAAHLFRPVVQRHREHVPRTRSDLGREKWLQAEHHGWESPKRFLVMTHTAGIQPSFLVGFIYTYYMLVTFLFGWIGGSNQISLFVVDSYCDW